MAKGESATKPRKPSRSLEQEAYLSLQRTADLLARGAEEAIKPSGLSATQYNVLRILRGAYPQGLTCSAIGSRMITAEPDITRLLARLKRLKLIRQQRDRHDRRVVWTHISAAGLELLLEMDPLIQKIPVELLGHLKSAELAELIWLLEAARRNCGEPVAQANCEEKCEAAGPESTDRPAPLPIRSE